MSDLSHLDDAGRARMVGVGAKPETARRAVAEAILTMRAETLDTIQKGEAPKGDVLSAARLAGIGAAKRTSDLIPLCHPLRLTSVQIDVAPSGPTTLTVRSVVEAVDRTGVEMEALTAASIAALTLYDMLKAIDRGMVIGPVRLLEKSGGRSGEWTAKE